MTAAPTRASAWVLASVRHHPWPTAVAGGSLILGVGVSLGSFALQSRFTTSYDAGHHLSGWQNFLRVGAPWQALIPVVLAALLAAWGTLRLGSSQPEPPSRLSSRAASSARRLREALRSERRAVGVAFVMISGLVGMVLVRVIVYALLALTGSRLAGATVGGVAIELAFWVAAWGSFWNWNRGYRSRLESWGVSDG
ncbi:MAG: hypothetical protein WAL64_09300 [Candidatus Dormiibacterota bacterium]